MSKIAILSDLHLEFAAFDPSSFGPSYQPDIVILAGDIATGTQGLDWAREKFPKQKIIYVAGNHEFYHFNYQELLEEFYIKAQRLHIHFLENNGIELDGVQFLGCTLWTDYQCYAEHQQSQSMQLLGNSLADHQLIQYGPQAELFSPEHALDLHRTSVKWLEQQLLGKNRNKTVVITHHGPSIACQHRYFGHSELAPGFYSDLDSLLMQSDYWIYGHTHSNLDKQIEKTRLIANQRGYPNERIDGFRADLIIEL